MKEFSYPPHRIFFGGFGLFRVSGLVEETPRILSATPLFGEELPEIVFSGF